MLIFIDLNFVLKGLLSLPCTFYFISLKSSILKPRERFLFIPDDNAFVLHGKHLNIEQRSYEETLFLNDNLSFLHP